MLHPQRHLTTTEQHHPRGLVAAATGIAADLHPVSHDHLRFTDQPSLVLPSLWKGRRATSPQAETNHQFIRRDQG
jgi:hypothetical protein